MVDRAGTVAVVPLSEEWIHPAAIAIPPSMATIRPPITAAPSEVLATRLTVLISR